MLSPNLSTSQFIALETYRRDGRGVITPTWIAGEATNLFIWTGADSWKVKRIHSNPHVRLCASDARGKPRSGWVDANASILDSPADLIEMEARLLKKYGLMFRFFKLSGRISGQNRHVVIQIRPQEPAA